METIGFCAEDRVELRTALDVVLADQAKRDRYTAAMTVIEKGRLAETPVEELAKEVGELLG